MELGRSKSSPLMHLLSLLLLLLLCSFGLNGFRLEVPEKWSPVFLQGSRLVAVPELEGDYSEDYQVFQVFFTYCLA